MGAPGSTAKGQREHRQDDSPIAQAALRDGGRVARPRPSLILRLPAVFRAILPQVLPMQPPPFSYHDPRTVADAVGLLGRLENAKILAGGQSLMPMLNMRYVLPGPAIGVQCAGGGLLFRHGGGA